MMCVRERRWRSQPLTLRRVQRGQGDKADLGRRPSGETGGEVELRQCSHPQHKLLTASIKAIIHHAAIAASCLNQWETKPEKILTLDTGFSYRLLEFYGLYLHKRGPSATEPCVLPEERRTERSHCVCGESDGGRRGDAVVHVLASPCFGWLLPFCRARRGTSIVLAVSHLSFRF